MSSEPAHNPATARLDYLVEHAHFVTFEAPEGAVMQYSRNEFRDLLAMYVREAVRRSMSLNLDAALIVARQFDEDAFACDFGGVTSINLPNLEAVVSLGKTPA